MSTHSHQCGPGSNHRAIIVKVAYSARNQVDKEPFRGRATSVASSFKRFKRNVFVNPNVLSENVEMRKLCNFRHETGLLHLKKDHTDIRCFLKNNKIERGSSDWAVKTKSQLSYILFGMSRHLITTLALTKY